MFWKWTPIVSTMAVASAIGGAPFASADWSDFQYVSTVSGVVRCVISSVHVSCEHSGGFPGAPSTESGGGKMNIARVESDGSFGWGLANMGSGQDNVVTLQYDTPYQFKGWSVAPSSEGTRFTNDATGHGMFVSKDVVDPF